MSEIKKWFFIIRPFTLPASLSPVIVGLYAASRMGEINLPVACVTIFCALCLQVLSNLVNDYCDFRRGSDGPDRLGPVRAVSRGIITPRQLLVAIGIDAVLCVVSGAYLIWTGGWPIILIGVSAMFFAWLYSATSHSISHLGISDIFTLSYYGFIASTGTTFLQTGQWSMLSFWLGLQCGALATAILAVNNIRDVNQDAAAGKKTLVVRLGVGFGKACYGLCVFAAPVAAYLVNHSLVMSLMLLPLSASLYYLFSISSGREYNRILLLTGLYDLIFALLSVAMG